MVARVVEAVAAVAHVERQRETGAEAATDRLVAALECHSKGDAAFRAGDFEAALLGYRKAHEASGTSALLVSQAACLNGLGRGREALALLDKALAAEAESAQFWHQRAIGEEQVGRWTSAQESCLRALACCKRQMAKGQADGVLWRVKADCLRKLDHPWLAMWAYARAWMSAR